MKWAVVEKKKQKRRAVGGLQGGGGVMAHRQCADFNHFKIFLFDYLSIIPENSEVITTMRLCSLYVQYI